MFSSDRRREKRGFQVYLDFWHRPEAIYRYLGRTRARQLKLIDIDSCEWCHLCYEPVALIETKHVDERSKKDTVTRKLAERGTLPSHLVEFEPDRPTEKCKTCDTPIDNGADITRFWVPNGGSRFEMAPAVFAEWLWSLRFDHWRSECKHVSAQRMLNFGGIQ